MKVLHLIPSAFNYFDDIRSEAFRLVGNLHKWGVEVEANTLQYGTLSKSKELEDEVIQGTTESPRRFGGMMPIGKVFDSLDAFDLVHLHVPFLGAAGKILAWKKFHPDHPLVITFYRPVPLVDFLSVFIKWYNAYYLPKIFAVADVLAAELEHAIVMGRVPNRFKERFVFVDDSSDAFGFDITSDPETADLKPSERLALKYVMLYNKLINNI